MQYSLDFVSQGTMLIVGLSDIVPINYNLCLVTGLLVTSVY